MPGEDLFNLVDEDDEDESVEPEAPPGQSLGKRLRERRRERGLSMFQAAQELRADPVLLRALEADDYSLLGAPVYIKGHLRKYAALLGLSPDSVYEDYARTHDVPESVPIVNRAVDPGRLHRSGYWLRLAGLLVLIAVLGAALAWWGSRPTPDPAPAEPGARGVRETPVPVALSEPATEVSFAPSTSTASLTLDLASDSWVEITDAQGERLLFGLMDAGATRSVTGAPPFDVVIGSAEGVRVEVDGRPYEIPARSIRGGIARFSTDGP
ncbi:DUF4115 domain-containing protein [soil metagenome]